jgi:hypothetical protein
VKMSIGGPPTTPTDKVPVVPDADMSTPFSTPVGLKGIVPGPTAVCLWAKLAGADAANAAARHRRKNLRFIEGTHCCVAITNRKANQNDIDGRAIGEARKLLMRRLEITQTGGYRARAGWLWPDPALETASG